MSVLDLAARFTNCTQAGDVAGAKACMHADAKIWQSYDQKTRSADEVMATLEVFKTKCKSYRYEIHRRDEVAGGYVQRHTLHLTSHAGKTYSTEVLALVMVTDGKISFVEEFIDPAPIMAALS